MTQPGHDQGLPRFSSNRRSSLPETSYSSFCSCNFLLRALTIVQFSSTAYATVLLQRLAGMAHISARYLQLFSPPTCMCYLDTHEPRNSVADGGAQSYARMPGDAISKNLVVVSCRTENLGCISRCSSSMRHGYIDPYCGTL